MRAHIAIVIVVSISLALDVLEWIVIHGIGDKK